MTATTPLVRSLGLGLLLAGIAVAGWQPIDSITDRDTSDVTTQSNARSVACDAAGNIHVVWRGRIGGVWQLWYTHLDSGDTVWALDETLTHTAGGLHDPSCVVGPDQSFYVAWNDVASSSLPSGGLGWVAFSDNRPSAASNSCTSSCDRALVNR